MGSTSARPTSCLMQDFLDGKVDGAGTDRSRLHHNKEDSSMQQRGTRHGGHVTLLVLDAPLPQHNSTLSKNREETQDKGNREEPQQRQEVAFKKQTVQPSHAPSVSTHLLPPTFAFRTTGALRSFQSTRSLFHQRTFAFMEQCIDLCTRSYTCTYPHICTDEQHEASCLTVCSFSHKHVRKANRIIHSKKTREKKTILRCIQQQM